MAEGSGTDHCQDWSQHPGDAGGVSTPIETEKGPLPPETIKLDYKNMSGKHAPEESPCVPTTKVIPAVSSAVKTTGRDMEQPQTTPLFQTNQTATSAFGIPQKQSTTNSAKQDCKLESKEAMEVVTQDLAKTDKEGAVSPIRQTLGTKQGNSGNSLCSGYASSKQEGEHITLNSGNSMPNDPDKGSCYPPEDCSKTQKALQRTKTPGVPTPPENTQCVQELSSQYVSLSETPKMFHLGKETSAREGQGNEKVPVDGHLCFNVAAKEVFRNISVDEPKLSGHGTCTDNVQVNERSQVMVCGSSDVILKQNDSANRIEISMSSNHHQDGSVLLTHKENCVTLEGLESDQPNLSDCMVQHVQESLPADHKLSQIQICLNDTADIVNVEERQEVSAEALSAVEVKDLIDVGILMQPDMEDTWLVVSEIDGQSEHAEMEVSEESLVQCPESQSTVAVYECTVPCFTSAALHSDVKLLLTDKEEEKPMETLMQDLQAQSNLGNQTSSRPDALKPTEELLTMPSTQKEESIIVKQNDDSSQTDLANTLTGLTCTVMDVTLDSVREQQESGVVENTPGVSLISLSCGTIDPKLLILKKADSPALKQPSSLSARISAKQNSPVPVETPSDGFNKASECLAKTYTAASSTIKEDAMLPADRPVSNTLSQSSRTVSTSNVLSQNSSEKENLNKLNSSDKLLQNESSANTSLSTSVQLHNSQSHLPPPAGDVWGTASSVVPEGNRCKQSLAGTPCQDSMSLGGELELEQQQLLDELLSTTQDAQNTILEPLDASIEESSDGEVDSSMEVQNEDSNATPSPAANKRGQSRTDKQGLLLKVCQWIAGKVTAVSTPSTSPVPCPSPSPSSGDWMRSHTGRASPVRNSHGRNMPSTSSQGYVGCSQSEQTTTLKSTPKHTDMAELAKHEAEIEHRTLALKREGFWSLKRLSRITEPVRPKVHWDYLCEEMQWLSADFAQERRWKRGVARKVVRMVMRHHEELRQKEERAKREEQTKLRRVASSIAKEVRSFWSSVEKVVQYKQQSRLEEKRKKALDLQLDFIVGQTERYSDMLSQSLQAAPVHSSDTAAVSKQSQLNAVDEDDRDFEPPCEEEDDEETIEVEEQQEGNDAETQRREIELLREEGTLPLDQLLSTLTFPQDVESEEEASYTTSSTVEEEDKEFSANEEDAEDEEDTIAAQEVIEGDGDHAEELDDISNWGPHLIIVPTSVMLNWEMELKRWCPGFKILTYYGSQKERKLKRQGWTKPNAFHVCITSYKLVLQDHQAFRRKSWRYLILDEAQNIKNFKSQRWQSLLNFNSQRRLLLTGTPLQNSLMELWSLMHFLMPHVFQSHREFKEWFSNPLTGMIEGSQEYNEGLVKRLHKVLRPFLLRRIKADVEKQMPKKYEHVVRCRLSKRQRFLYDDFMAQASTRETLASGHFMSVINILMQLRKVCNHPNLFDPRPIQSPFITKAIVYSTASLVQRALETSPFERCDLSLFDLIGLEQHVSRYQADVFLPQRKVTHQLIQEIMESPDPPPRPKPVRMKVNRMLQPVPKSDGRSSANSPRPSTTTVQTPKPLITEVTPSQTPSQPAPQVCPVTPVAAPRTPVAPSNVPSAPAVRPPAPQPVTVRPSGPSSVTTVSTPPQPPSNIMTQRVLLSPDMQARLPSGEVVSIAQLASLAGRPVSSSQGSKPVTFQLQGNKLTLSGTPLNQVPVPQPRPIQGNVMHLVSSSGQHHLISQPAQVTVLHTVSQSGSSSANPHPTSTIPTCSGLAVPFTVTQVPTPMVSGPGIVKIVVRQAPSKEGGSIPTLAVPPSPRPAPPQSVTLHPHGTSSPVLRAPTVSQPPQRPPVYAAPPRTVASSQTPPTRPVLRVVQGPPPPAPEPPVTKAKSSLVREDSGNDVITLRMSTPKPASSSQSSGSTSQRPRVQPPPPPRSPFYMSWLADCRKAQRDNRISQIMRINDLHCSANPVYGHEVLDFLTFLPGPCPSPPRPVINNWSYSGYSSCLTAQSHHTSSFLEKSQVLKEAIHHSEERLQLLSEIIERFTFVIPPVEAKPITMHTCHPPPSLRHQQGHMSSVLSSHLSPLTQTLHRIQCNMRTHFPDLRLIQYDCGKLQTLHLLLRKLKAEGHRVLIFTQMTRMLDILEQFLNYHGHIYLRLDGSTRVEQRQALMERFNADCRIFCFILSTRSGGVGVNLTGADTVVFYDSDWNPTMDAQAQDRCHRIGQTRDVHIYRLISERTVEENILKKANQKRMLGDMAIEGGNFTTTFFKQQTIRELFDVSEGERKEAELSVPQSDDDESVNKQQTTILEQALCRAEDEEDIVAASQAKAEQVAELAEFNENIPLDDGDSRDQEEEELSKAEQEIAALVEQLTPIERYAMNFLEASLEDICKEELKLAEEQVEAARKGLDQAKEEGLKLHQSSDSDEEDSIPPSTEEPTPSRRPRKHKEKGAPSTRVSGRLRGTPADDISLTQPSPERGRRGAWMNSECNMSQTLESKQKSPLHREVPEKLCSGQRGRGTTKESVSLTSSENQTVQTNQQLSDSTALSPTMRGSDPKIRCVPSPHQQPISPSSSVPSAAASPAMDKNSSGHQSSSCTACREDSEEQGGEALSETVQCSRRDRRTSASSDSICSPEHHSEQDGQLPLSPTLASPNSRSPRKRQSAEREILKGLPEDSPSAKVLRKLPGRLVTVVEEKEPKRRRRGLSGSGGAHTEGSSEETEQAEPVPDPASQSSDGGSQIHKDSSPKSVPTSLASSPPPQEQDQASSPLQISPGRGHHPCSPAHYSPDMPVLRNLPVRRRLETESRMAAQLGEQFVGRGRGVDRRSVFSPKKPETNSDKDRAAPSDSMAMKRKRGRPPKTPPQALELREEKTPVTQKTSPERNPSHSPKRKRGRPRKDSTTTTSSSPSSPSTCAPSSQEPNLSRSNVMPVTLPAVSNTSPISFPLNPTSPSNAAEVSSSKLDSETNQKTTSDLLYSMHRDSQNMSSSTSELGVDSHGETHTNLNPIIVCIDSDTSTFETSPHNTSPATISQTCTASSPTLHPPSPLREPPTCTVSIHEEELAHTPVLFETSEITASSEPSKVSATAVEIKEVSLTVNQQKDHLQSSNTLTQVTSQPLHRTSTTEDSPQTSVEHMCSIAVSLTPTHQSSTQPSPSPSLTSGIKPESSSFKSEAQEPTVTLTVSTVQQSTPKSDQTSVPPSQPQTTDIEAATDSALESHKMSSTSSQSPSTTNQITTNSLSTSNYTDADSSQSKNMPVETMADNHEGQHSPKEEVVTEEEVVTRETEKMEIDSVAEDDAGEKDGILSQLKRRKLVRLPKEQTPGASGVASSNSDIESHDDPKIDGPDKPSEEESRKYKETRTSAKKRSISRQSSQESVRSSSPSSVSSCGTRSSQSKKAGESRRPAKRKQEDTKSEKEKNEEESDKKHQSNSSSSSSDSEDFNSIKRCLTRSAQKKLEKGGVIDKNEESSKRQQGSSDKKGKTTNTTEGESSGETCSKVTRKSAGPQPNTLASPEPEVLGKRCSALNAAAKLLAMRGRGPDTPSPRSKTATQQSKPLSSEKSSKPKGKTGQESPKISNSKAGSGRQTPNQSNESPQSSSSARSTRQRPGSLVPPLETERVKKEEKKKTSDQKEEGEDENRETRSSGGHSACSSISSERGAGSSRSRSSSSSNSSQRTHSLSSQSTEPTRSRSRAASSGSDTERGKSIWHKSDGGRGRESRKEKRSQKQDKLELSAGSSDGTLNRVLRSVAAIAAAQARTPASNTRSSSTQNRHSKT
ncbi:helicase SRCAP-like [Sinocyclocheilus rhinocerous]|uniref:helicase SRCAP-like n=1 Tax=Sinocyclocheilus rhinocerous TaxID=307959 RepID=UPI0007B7E1B6|nr:PREDICTED: helicase SRCAP-like [Sinocyclocheilus rhinocerous]